MGNPNPSPGTRFKPGHPDFAAGKHWVKKPITRALEAIYSDPAEAMAVAKAIHAKAKRGNIQAIHEIADRLQGKAVQAIDLAQADMPTDDQLPARIVDWLGLLAAARGNSK